MTLSDDDARAVRRIALFSDLSDDAFARLAARMRPVSLAAGSLLFLQDEPAGRFYLLLDGWVKLSRLSEDGAETIVNVVAPGESFAEAAVFAQGVFPVCAEAVTDGRALTLNAADFREAIAENAEIALAMLGALSLRLRQLVHQIESLQVKSAPRRVADFLLRLCPAGVERCTLDLPLNKALIARRLGMRPETLSRALARLKAAGVAPQDGRLIVASVAELRRFCEPGDTGGVDGTCS